MPKPPSAQVCPSDDGYTTDSVQTFYSIAMWVGIIVAIVFAGLVFLTGKGDAMSGGSSSVRTTFKGKTSFDDIMAKWTLRLGIVFMALMLFIDVIGNNLPTTLK
jgi:protein translocase SecG subunit